MKKYVNGDLIDMTADEIAELEQKAAQLPAPEPTTEERIAVLEEELKAAKILLGLEE